MQNMSFAYGILKISSYNNGRTKENNDENFKKHPKKKGFMAELRALQLKSEKMIYGGKYRREAVQYARKTHF